jgi:hypothetical protein
MVRAALALAVVGWTAGCGQRVETCAENCPRLAGQYAIEDSTLQGACAFTPYVVAPTLTLTQPGQGAQLSAELLDPVNRVPVQLTGRVLRGEEGATEEEGSFHLTARVVRQASSGADQLVTLDLNLTGTVLRDRGQHRLNAQLGMIQLDGGDGQGCQVTLTVIGRRL